MRVLIVRVGAMGDVLHALPAVAALRLARPQWQIDWVVDPRWAALLVDEAGDGPVVSRVHQAETKLWSRSPFSWATLRSVRVLRAAVKEQRYDLVVDMQGTLRSAVIGRFAGARRFVGYGDPREAAAGWLYAERVARLAAPQGLKPLASASDNGGAKAPPLQSNSFSASSEAQPLQSSTFSASSEAQPLQSEAAEAHLVPLQSAHVVEQGAALLGEACGFELKPDAFALPQVRWAEEWAEREAVTARPLCLLSAGAGWGAKQWPVERYGELAIALRRLGFDVVVNAPRADDAVVHAVVAASAGAARMVVCDVAGLAALMRRVDLFVGGDTGPLHLAAALAVPLVALFGPTDPARNGPWGPGPKMVLRDAASVTSYRHVDAVDAGLARISVEQVVEAVRGLVAKRV